MSRTAKKLVISIIYLLIFALVVFLIYQIFKPDPTCIDGKLNQNEEQVDCGGPCQACPEAVEAEDLQIVETAIIPAGNSTYDLVAKIKNPNGRYGIQPFSVVVNALDGGGNSLGAFSEESFILPQQEKYFLRVAEPLSEKPKSLQISFENVRWQRFSSYQEPEIAVSNKEYNLISSGVGFSELKGIIYNNSPFDFRDLTLEAVLRDKQGNILSVNKTNMQTVLSREEREFRMFWPKSFPGDVNKIEVAVYVDFFQDENFVYRYLAPQKFQQP